MCPIHRDLDLTVRNARRQSCLTKWGHCTIGYSLTLFQGLATAAGYDPARGSGSSCLGSGASGKCVLPWGSGTKSVSSIVLVANGASFAVCPFFLSSRTNFHLPFVSGHGTGLWNHRSCSRLSNVWQVVTPYFHRDMLGCPVREHKFNMWVTAFESLLEVCSKLFHVTQHRAVGLSRWHCI